MRFYISNYKICVVEKRTGKRKLKTAVGNVNFHPKQKISTSLPFFFFFFFCTESENHNTQKALQTRFENRISSFLQEREIRWLFPSFRGNFKTPRRNRERYIAISIMIMTEWCWSFKVTSVKVQNSLLVKEISGFPSATNIRPIAHTTFEAAFNL